MLAKEKMFLIDGDNGIGNQQTFFREEIEEAMIRLVKSKQSS